MLGRLASTVRTRGRTIVNKQRFLDNVQHQQRRKMGGGSHWMEVSDTHTKLGEAFGFVCWLWIFHRAHNDLGVVLGWRHPWEHAEDPWAAHDNVENIEDLEKDWESFAIKAANPEDDDDDDDEDEDDDEDDDDDEEDEEEE